MPAYFYRTMQKPTELRAGVRSSVEPFEIRIPNSAGATGRVARRTKLGDDGNQMKADGNSFPVFILGWTIGASCRLEQLISRNAIIIHLPVSAKAVTVQPPQIIRIF